MDLVETLKGLNDRLYNSLMITKDEAKEVLDNRIHIHFTDHSINHSCRIIDHLGELVEELMGSELKLNEYELFILLSAIFLHDIGMQFDKVDILEHYIDEFSGHGNDEIRLELVRKHHGRISYLWILENLKENKHFQRKVYHGEPELGELTAIIAESHTVDINENQQLYRDRSFKSKTIRMKLLACLLSLGDVLDADSSRVDFDRLKHVDVPTDSKLHWLKHYYVSGLIFDKGILTISYTFPNLIDRELDIYREFFTSEINYWILKNKEKHKEVLSPNFIRFEINELFDVSDLKNKVSEDEFSYMENSVLSRRISLIERIRQELSLVFGLYTVSVKEEEEDIIITYQGNSVKIIKVPLTEFKNRYNENISKIKEILNNKGGNEN